MTSRSQLFLPIIFTYSWAQQIWRSPGIMTILVTCLNPAIGSGFMLPDYMYELMSGEQCQIWYTAAWRTFLFCKLGYREVFMPLLFITLALEWHIVKCEVAFHAVAFKLICLLCALQSNSSRCLRCLVSLNALSMVISQFVQCYETELAGYPNSMIRFDMKSVMYNTHMPRASSLN